MRRPTLAHVVAAVIAALAGGPAVAFKKSFHETVSANGVKLHAECFASRGLGEEGRQVELGAFTEDDEGGWSRVANWHFYNRFGKPRFLVFHTTLDKVLAERGADLCEALRAPSRDGLRESVWFLAGRVVHYIQDMSVPAHVIPVWHVPPFEDSFDGYGLTGYDAREPLADVGRDACGGIDRALKHGGGPQELVEASAAETWESIHKPISSEIESHWAGNFWCTSPTKGCEHWLFPGFLTYLGEDGGESFGRDQPVYCSRGEKKTCIVGKREYRKFFAERYRQAVVYSAAWVERVRRAVAGEPGGLAAVCAGAKLEARR